MHYRLLILSLFCSFAVWAQSPIVYTLDLADIQHHELGVSIDFPALPPQPLVVRMPTSSPGRYAEHNFAKNVYAVKAYNQAGQALEVSRTGLNEWTVSGHGGAARFEYTLFANRADGTYAKVDNRKLHLNMPATFAYGVGFDKRPIELQFPKDQQKDWKIATQLEALGDRRFRAPDYYYFFDSPTMMSDIRFRSWTVEDGGKMKEIEIAFMTPDSDSMINAYTEWTKLIVARQKEVYGELPDFDFDRYTFLCAYNEYVSGDGMEHRNSTICTAPVALDGFEKRLIGTVSHEFFHAWNVERLRPASLEPFTFDEANVSNELWFAEGFTSYFDDLTLARVGILDEEAYVNGINSMFNYVLNSPGLKFRSPVGMSQCAPFVDAATAIDSDNFDNTFISYYSYGAVLGLGLDLELRRDHNTNLDAFMRLAWQRYGKTEVPYNIPDLQQCLADLTKDEAFAKQWFAQHVYASSLPDYKALFADFGILLTQENPDKVGFYKLELEAEDGVYVADQVNKNNTLYAAGLEQGDQIVALNGQAINSLEDWETAVANLKLDKSYNISYIQNGLEVTAKFVAAADPTFVLSLDESASKKALKRRAAWLK